MRVLKVILTFRLVWVLGCAVTSSAHAGYCSDWLLQSWNWFRQTSLLREIATLSALEIRRAHSLDGPSSDATVLEAAAYWSAERNRIGDPRAAQQLEHDIVYAVTTSVQIVERGLSAKSSSKLIRRLRSEPKLVGRAFASLRYPMERLYTLKVGRVPTETELDTALFELVKTSLDQPEEPES